MDAVCLHNSTCSYVTELSGSQFNFPMPCGNLEDDISLVGTRHTVYGLGRRGTPLSTNLSDLAS